MQPARLSTSLPPLSAEVGRVSLIPSELGQGEFWTVCARVSLTGPEGVNLGGVPGFATGVEPTQEVLDRAVSEALERSIWAWLHRRGDAVGHSTAGCAVHVDALTAERVATIECFEKRAARALFTRRELGTEVTNLRACSTPYDSVRLWYHRPAQLVTAASFEPQRGPKLILTSASCLRSEDLPGATLHAAAELAQVTPWLVRLAKSDRPAVRSSTYDRARWWSSITVEESESIWSSLSRGRPDADQARPPVSSLRVSHRGVVLVNNRELHFARVEGSDTSEPCDRHDADGMLGTGVPSPYF